MKKLLLILTAVLLVGCSNSVMDTKIPNDSNQWDAALSQTIQKLPEEDKKILAAYMLRAKLGEAFGGQGIPEGMTIGKAIAEQKEFMKKQAEQ